GATRQMYLQSSSCAPWCSWRCSRRAYSWWSGYPIFRPALSYPSISSLRHELLFEQPCTQDLRSCASQDTVQSEQRSLEKRGLIYRTGSFAKGTQEAHRSPRSQQICLFAKQSATYKGRAFHRSPPAQIRTCGFPAYGSCLGCVTAQDAVYAPAPVARLPGSVPGTCFAGAYSPWPPPFAPPTPLRPPPQTSPQWAFFALFAGFIATMTRSDFSRPCIIGFGYFPSRCGRPYSAQSTPRRRPDPRPPRFRCNPFARDVAFDPGRASAPRIAVPHMLPSSEGKPSAPAISDLSWLNPTPHAIAVYASQPLSPVTTQHSLPSGRYSLLGPDFHRLDRTSSCR